MVSLTRTPGPPLRPFVKLLWGVDSEAPHAHVRHELMLPTGTVHIVVRIAGTPVHIAEQSGRSFTRFADGIVGGPRSGPYLKHSATRGVTVGALLHPGAAVLLLGAPGSALSEQHVALDALWGRAAVDLRDQLAEARTMGERLDLFERALVARLPKVRGVHPAVAHGVAELSVGADVARVVEASGYSHRRFIALFREACGYSPKTFARLMRFQRALALVHGRRELGLCDVAQRAGYSDQAHMTREFVAFASLSPGAYRALAPHDAHHVLLANEALARGQIRSRPPGEQAPS